MRSMNDAAILSGVAGYAHKQAAIWERMANQCARYWLPRLKTRGIITSWEADYVDVANNSGIRQAREVDLAARDIGGDEGTLELDGNEEDEEDEDEENFEIGGDEGDFSDLDLDDWIYLLNRTLNFVRSEIR